MIYFESMRPLFLLLVFATCFAKPLFAQTSTEYEEMLEESSDEHIRLELGVNPITVPSIQELLQKLEEFYPVPIELIEKNPLNINFTNRVQTGMHFGSLIADGFMLTIAQRAQDIERIGRALVKEAHSLGIGDELTSHSKSLLEKSSRNDWIGLRRELIETQADVENSIMELRDEEMAHMISLGGWLRGFQLAAHATAATYSPVKASRLVDLPVMDYFLERIETLPPPMRRTEFMSTLLNQLKSLRLLAEQTEGRSPTEQEVEQMKNIADTLFAITLAKVDENGKIEKMEADTSSQN